VNTSHDCAKERESGLRKERGERREGLTASGREGNVGRWSRAARRKAGQRWCQPGEDERGGDGSCGGVVWWLI